MTQIVDIANLESERVVGGGSEAGDAVVGEVEAGEVGAEAGKAARHHRERVVRQVLLSGLSILQASFKVHVASQNLPD